MDIKVVRSRFVYCCQNRFPWLSAWTQIIGYAIG